MKKNPNKTRPIVLSVNIDDMIRKAEKKPKPNSCVVVDVISELMEMGHLEWMKKHAPHKRQKPK